MGTIRKGILGGFKGKVGTVVGSSWKGIAYMRGQAQHIKNPRTAGQVYQREALKVLALALKPISSTLNLTFKESANKMSGYNKAVSVNYKEALVNQDGQPIVDLSKLILSQGSLPKGEDFAITNYIMENDWCCFFFFGTIGGHPYPSSIQIIYDVDDEKWHTFISPYREDYECYFMGVMSDDFLESHNYHAWACGYDPATGKVSDSLYNFMENHS